MANIAGKVSMRVLTMAIGIPVSIATKRIVEKAWHAARPEDPPRRADDDGVRWGDAIAWAALSGAGMVLADLLTRKSAESTYRVLTGLEPPEGKTPKSQKKLAGAQRKVEA